MHRNSGPDREEDAWPLQGQAWLSRIAGAGWLKEQDKGEWDKLQFKSSLSKTTWPTWSRLCKEQAITEGEQRGGCVKF